jgi:LuxR family quorum sensing-dependent transcriptional regulator
MSALAERGLQFIDRCLTKTAAASVEDFLATIRQMGFNGVACGAWAGVGKNRRHRFFFVNWPADWLDLYNKSGWFEIDPLAQEARRRIAPFVLSEIDAGKFSTAQREFLKAAWAYGWREGLAVPIHGPGSLQGLLAMVARRDNLVLSASDRAVLEAMARTVWERCRTSEGFGVTAAEQPKLSSREIECLQWAAAGKSDADIAALVGISAATAHFHIERAKTRLGVKTRVEAVAVGVLHGII